MRRLALTSLAAACAICAAPTSLTPSAGALVVPKRADARVRVVACKPALDPLNRSLTVDSVMRSLANNDRMQMRFDLYQRALGARRFRRLTGPGLGTWNAATPGIDRFRFRKPIQNLPAPATYFVRVSYRWLNAQGSLLARTTRSAPMCVQPDLRPDLRLGTDLAGTRRVGSNRVAYRVLLRNTGRSAAGAFDVVGTIAGAAQPPVSLFGLAAHARQVVEIQGPRCAQGQAVKVALDPDDRVDETDEGNNERSFPCPL